MNVPPSALGPIVLAGAGAETMATAMRWIDPIRRMARASDVRAQDGALPKDSAQAVLDDVTVVLPLAGLIDLDVERKRLATARTKAVSELDKVLKKLSNEDFVRRAREEVVEENRERQANFEAEIVRLDAALARIA